MRGAASWHDARILNLSSRGLLLHTDRPPERGSYLEVRRGPHVIVARVVWTRAKRVGLKAQDVIPIDAIVREQPAPQRCDGTPVERRHSPRTPRPTTDARLRGSWMQALGLFMATISAAAFALLIVDQALGSAVDQVTAALTASRR